MRWYIFSRAKCFSQILYRLGVPVTKMWSYLISIFYFKFPIFLTIINLILNASNSNCKLEIIPKSSYDKNQKIIYSCTFKDEYNDEINVVDSQNGIILKLILI